MVDGSGGVSGKSRYLRHPFVRLAAHVANG